MNFDCRFSKHGLLVKVECSERIPEECTLDITPQNNTLTYYIYPYQLWKLIDCLSKLSIKVHSEIKEPQPLNLELRKRIILRDYQLNIIRKIKTLNYKGTIMLPTGAGKTILALEIISSLKLPTLVTVPTIALLKQWENVVKSYFSMEEDGIGIYGGGEKKIGEITLATYKSASTHNFLTRNMDNFGLIIFDEAHHLLNARNIEIPRRLTARHRIGLTATIHEKEYATWGLDKLVGQLIQGPTIAELQMRNYSAELIYKPIPVKLTKLELDLLNKMRKKKQRRKIMRKLIYFPTQKINKVEELLKRHAHDQVIIFTKHKETAREIAETFGIPLITSDIPPTERFRFIKLFAEKKITKIVTAEVLDEGVDIPSANVAIIVSGRGSNRQLIQRIGRILRPKGGEKAFVYELYTKKTFEEKIYRRRQ